MHHGPQDLVCKFRIKYKFYHHSLLGPPFPRHTHRLKRRMHYPGPTCVCVIEMQSDVGGMSAEAAVSKRCH